MSAQDKWNGRLPPGLWGPVDDKNDNPKPLTAPMALSGEVFLLKADDPSTSAARLLARFENSSLQETYEAVGIDRQRWKAWEEAKKSGGIGTLSEKYPMLSKLAWWFEQPVRFTPAEARQLHQELLEIQNSSRNVKVVSFTTTMLKATQESIDAGQPLGVYP